jgi:hypothetical protein
VSEAGGRASGTPAASVIPSTMQLCATITPRRTRQIKLPKIVNSIENWTTSQQHIYLCEKLETQSSHIGDFISIFLDRHRKPSAHKTLAMATRDVHTPEPVAPSRRAGISEVQKQALISNLQLESTSLGCEEIANIGDSRVSQLLNERASCEHNTPCRRKVCGHVSRCA